MKHPHQFWHEYKTSVYGEAILPVIMDVELRRSFYAGAEATFKAFDSVDNADEEYVVESLDWFRAQNRADALNMIGAGNIDESPTMDISDMIHAFRTLRLSQVRKQLEADERNNLDRLFHIYHFLKLAKEQQP